MITFKQYSHSPDLFRQSQGDLPRTPEYDAIALSEPFDIAILNHPEFIAYQIRHHLIDLASLWECKHLDGSIIKAIMETKAFDSLSDTEFHNYLNNIRSARLLSLLYFDGFFERIMNIQPETLQEPHRWVTTLSSYWCANETTSEKVQCTMAFLFQHSPYFIMPMVELRRRFLKYGNHDIYAIESKSKQDNIQLQCIKSMHSIISEKHFFDGVIMHTDKALWDTRFLGFFSRLPECVYLWDIFQKVSMDDIIQGHYDTQLHEQISQIPGMVLDKVEYYLPSSLIRNPLFIFNNLKKIISYLDSQLYREALFYAIEQGILNMSAYNIFQQPLTVEEPFEWFDNVIKEHGYAPDVISILSIKHQYEAHCTLCGLTNAKPKQFKHFVDSLSIEELKEPQEMDLHI